MTFDPARLETLSDEEIAQTLEISPQTLADYAKTIAQHSPASTIEPSQARSDTPGRLALAGLGEQRDERGIAGGLVLGATLGEGGMGIVRTATQRSLGRRVAVKTLRAEVRSEQATLRLLREAWVTGSLEHPNIVPVYDLGLSDDGSPVIVLKHIEGVEWASLIHDARAVRERFGATDLLEYNLRILLQLCNAVSLAHARGILHRDLKPENVMIGRFGEVYLVDWGIAVSLVDDPTGRLPRAADASEMAGTPAYMAPEMLGAIGKLSERTDVYLLGAMLHEILTGAPPHGGANFRQLVGSILMSDPRYPEGVPEPLAEIARRAMRRDASERFASADELRARIEWYLRHRGSLALSEEAKRRLEEMRVASAGEGDIWERVYHLFGEAKFGFRQALAASDDNVAARDGLREAIELVVRLELDRGTPEGAASALAELESPDPELAKRVDEALRARKEQAARFARLEELSADLDPSTGRRTRLAVVLMLGAVWMCTPEIAGFLERATDSSSVHLWYGYSVVLVALGLLVVRWGRESLMKTVLNRRFVAVGIVTFAMQLSLELGGQLLGLPIVGIVVLHLLVWSMCMTGLAVFVDRRFWVSASAYLAAFIGVAAYPAARWHVMSVGHAILVANVVFAWYRNEDPDFFHARMQKRFERLGRRR